MRTIIGFVLRDWLRSQVSDAEFRKQFRQLHEDLFSAGSGKTGRVVKNAHRSSGVTKAIENSPGKPTESMAGSHRFGRSRRCGLRNSAAN